jgi:hypothetical protein
VSMQTMPSAGGYMAVFRAEGPRPEPGRIASCRYTPDASRIEREQPGRDARLTSDQARAG